MKTDVAGLKIDPLSKRELLDLIAKRIASEKKTWLTTVYSEFLYAGLRDPKVMQMLNQADIAVPDGIGIFWAKKFLEIPLTAANYWFKILQAWWQVKYSLLAVLFYRKWILCSLPINRPINGQIILAEKIPGSELIWDIAKMATEKSLSIYLLGGFGDTPELTAKNLISSKRNGRYVLRIAGYSSKNPDNESVIADINKTKPDILLVAYGPIRQERWIFENRGKLPSVKLFVGLGGTFDYIAGKRISPPSFIRKIGLEWLWRLFTQPHRIGRIFNATIGLIIMLTRFKVFNSCPLRKNAAAIILNKNNQALICQRDPKNHHVDIIHNTESLGSKNYWQFPQGGIASNEDFVAAAKREATEETGLKNLEFIKISEHTNTYHWNNALRQFWKNRHHTNRGQQQHIAYFRHSGNDNDVRVDNNEFISYRWVPVDHLISTIHSERLPLTKIVQTDLREMAEKGII